MFELRAKSTTETDILMYGSISEWGKVRAEDLINKLAVAKAGGYSRINLKINSPGGQITEGVALMTQLSSHDLYITGTVEGMAASMASVFLQGCHKRRMVRAARLMVHQGQGGVFGSANYIRNYADLLESYNKTIADIYAKRGKRDAKYILENWMPEGKDTWFTAEQALKEGLIDEIIEGVAKPLEKEQATLMDMAAHYEQFFNDTNEQVMNKEQLIKQLGLKADATEAEITAAIAALKTKAEAATPPQPEPPAATPTEKLISGVVALAKERGADEKLQASIKKIAAIDVDAAMDMIPAAGAAAATSQEGGEKPQTLSLNALVDALSKSNNSSAPDRKNWTLDEWESKDSNGLMEMAKTRTKEYITLFKAKHGFEPSESEIKQLVG